MKNDKISKLQDWISNSTNIVFFGGAGVSTESGIPDFRSVGGLYHEKCQYPPETILSASFYYQHRKEFYQFYKAKMICPEALPNPAHLKLAELEAEGRLRAIVTQNIDGLHQKAGSEVVYELHGSTLRNYCESCHKFYQTDYILQSESVPICSCGGFIKPDVVLYEEGLEQKTIENAVKSIEEAQVLIVGGTSLAVYPAAGLLQYYKGNQLVLINKSPTPLDSKADLLLQGSIGEILSSITT